MEELRREIAQMKQAERNRCQLRRTRVKIETESAASRARRELEERRRAERHAERVEKRRAQMARAVRRETARAESDDEVRQNIEADLVPIFDRVRSRIRARPGVSRTESFVHWVEENPAEVWAMREDLAERRLRALLREEARAARQLAKAGGRARRRAQVAAGAEEEPPPF